MTTIVFRDNILAGDTRAFSGSPQPMGKKQKIFKVAGGSCFGVSTSHPGLGEEIRNWYEECKHFDHQPQLNGRSFEMLEIDTDGNVFFYNDSFNPSGPLIADYFAIGSGSEYALGALSMGASAVEAVTVASQHDIWTNDFIQNMNVLAVDTEAEQETSNEVE